MVAMKLRGSGRPLLPLLLLAAVSAATASATPAPHAFFRHSQCTPISIGLCRSTLPYNDTMMPNLVGIEDQSEAELQLTTFTPLIQVNCASELKFFLCSVFAPMCTPKVPISIGPCRPLCERVMMRCAPTLKQFGFPWPASLNCSKFPQENNADAMCMHGPVDKVSEPADGVDPVHQHREEPVAFPPRVRDPCATRHPGQSLLFVNRTGGCALRCHSEVRFSRTEKRTAETVAFILASLSCVTGALGLLLLRCTRTSLGYPELPIVFIVLCSTLASLPHFVRFFAGRDGLGCVDYGGLKVLVGAGLEHVPCTVTGIILLFFATAAKLWWALLCWLWFLSVGLSWSDAALGLHGFAYHVVVWAASLVGVIAVLVRQSVDADELSGQCFLGQQAESRESLVFFLVGPDAAILVLGALPLLFLTASLACLNGERRAKLGSASGQAYWSGGIVSLSYVPIATTLLSCYLSESGGFGTSLLRLVASQLFGTCAAVALIVRLAGCATPGRYPGQDKDSYSHQPLPGRPSSGSSARPPPSSAAQTKALYTYEAPAQWNLQDMRSLREV